MPIVRAFLALVAGFLSMAILVGVITAGLMKLSPQWVGVTGHPRPAYVLVNLAYSLLAVMSRGYVTAWTAAGNPWKYVLVLAIIVLLLGALSALQQRGMRPIWYQLLLMLITPAGVSHVMGLIAAASHRRLDASEHRESPRRLS